MFVENLYFDAVAKGGFLSAFCLLWIIFLVRIVGLRSFSKMTNFDFVITVAMGSLLAGASQTTSWPNLLQTVTAMTCLFAVRYAVAKLRHRFKWFDKVVQNTPVVLVKNGTILEKAMRKTRVSEDDLLAKLRVANVLDIGSVRAVILETTGDVSVLHGDHLEETLLQSTSRH
jgi:uncharacterized membrane protein YcaP (DUF421 family)